MIVDDFNGDEMTGAIPTYLPNNSFWIQGQLCTGCSAKPDASQTHDGTWHDTTHSIGNDPRLGQKSISIPFVGENQQNSHS